MRASSRDSLCDQDRERVEDDEAADQHRDAGEDQQEDLDDPEELPDRGLGLVGDLVAGRRFEVVGDDLLGGVGELLLRHPVRRSEARSPS